MALTSVNGELNASDIRDQPIGFGTVSGQHLIPRSATGRNVNTVIDDTDPRIQYGTSGISGEPGGFDLGDTVSILPFVGGTVSVLGGTATTGVAGSAAQLYFEGTSIAIIGATNSTSGKYRVFIDGVETKGRLPVAATLQPPASFDFANLRYSPAIGSTDPSFQVYGGTTGFPASNGVLMIGSELMTYTTLTGTIFSGVTRGAFGTNAVPHYNSETVYLWDSSLDLSGLASSAYTVRDYLYYNPMLSPGQHRVTIVSETGTNGYARIYFDGFVVGNGGLLGSDNISLRYGTFVISPLVTDANGHSDIGYPVTRTNDFAFISVVGYSQSNTETSNTTAMGQIGLRWNPTGNAPLFYMHNGPPSASFTLYLHFSYIGNSL